MTTRENARPARPRALSPEAQAAMMALDVQIAAEDAEERRRERQRRKAGLPASPRDITAAPDWAGGGVTARASLL